MTDARPPEGPVLLSALLRERTRESHERTEATLDLLGPGLTRDRYRRLLERWYGFESTWERYAPAVLGEAYARPRRKLPLLRSDLLACGVAETDLAALPTVPENALPFTDRARALGIVYVVEGSTLGGQHVARFVGKHLGLSAEHGTAYFASYGPDVGRRWRETKALLDAPPFPADADAVIAGATAAFDFLGTWLVPSPGTLRKSRGRV